VNREPFTAELDAFTAPERMNLRTFRGRDLQQVFEQAASVFGEDVMVLRTHTIREEGGVQVEVVAASEAEVESLKRRLEADPLPLPGMRGKGHPLVIALVGPTGAGKTTTIAKLAVHPQAFGGWKVGLVTLDTYRVGAVEQLGTFAEIAGLPLEVIYSRDEVREAKKRLAGCDVVLVDTPGRSPRLAEGEAEWEEILTALAPDEVHLVQPANIRLDIATTVRDRFLHHGTTHLLLSKLDEVPGEMGIAELASRAELPARWVTDGQDVPADLRTATPRIIASLGASPAGWAA
jgi:flagellar biosynthesis protein FlhF